MKKFIFLILTASLIYSCIQSSISSDHPAEGAVSAHLNELFGQEQKEVNSALDSFNSAAAKADYICYFNFYTDGAVFAGTDATERWNKKEFMVWAKPYFEKKTTWKFTSPERHIFY